MRRARTAEAESAGESDSSKKGIFRLNGYLLEFGPSHRFNTCTWVYFGSDQSARGSMLDPRAVSEVLPSEYYSLFPMGQSML